MLHPHPGNFGSIILGSSFDAPAAPAKAVVLAALPATGVGGGQQCFSTRKFARRVGAAQTAKRVVDVGIAPRPTG